MAKNQSSKIAAAKFYVNFTDGQKIKKAPFSSKAKHIDKKIM